MARLLTTKDVYGVVNAMVEDLTGQTAAASASVRDTSTFISAGELILSYPMENVLNSLGILMGKIFVAARPYKGRWDLINSISTGEFTHRMEKISFYSQKALPSGAFNTDLFTNLAPGFTNGQNPDANDDPQSTKSMWEQHPGIPLAMYFGGSSTWQECITMYEIQLQAAFRKGPGEFNEFISGMLVEHENDIELQKEAFRNAIVLNHIAGVIDLASDMNGSAVNLTYEFNQKYGTSYTSAELRSTYLKEFLAFMVARIKNDSRLLSHKSVNYHWSPDKQVNGVDYALLRHTPRNRQKIFMYQPLWTDAEAMVLPEIFNDEYLSIDNYEGVDYWQFENKPAAIDVTPAIPDTDSTSSTFGEQIKGAEVDLDYVVGCIFDTDAMMADFQIDSAASSPLEARKRYRNIWLTIAKNGINDFTEKAIVYYMADPSNP